MVDLSDEVICSLLETLRQLKATLSKIDGKIDVKPELAVVAGQGRGRGKPKGQLASVGNAVDNTEKTAH